MLERAAGCLEHAKRRFLRDPNGVLRTRKSLPRHFWKHGGAGLVVPCWLFALLQISGQRPSPAPGRTRKNQTANQDLGAPFLEFLYPRHTQQFAISTLSRTSKRLALRRRKKTLDNFPRSYASEAATFHPACEHENHTHEGTKPDEKLSEWEKEIEQAQTKKNLSALLDEEGSYFDRAWILYISAGCPQNLSSALCAYLRRSERSEDQERAWQAFERIAPENRSADDYLHITQSQLLSAEAPQLKFICQQAVSKGLEGQCCALAFAYYVRNHRWLDAREISTFILESPERGNRSQPPSRFSQLDYSTLFKSALSLADFLREQPTHVEAFHDFAHSFLCHIFTSISALERASSESILQTLIKYNELGLLTRRHYFHLIGILQTSDVRSTFVRSIVFYRHFRWQMPDSTPPRMLLDHFLKTLVSFEITAGIQYFLDEWTRFHKKPSIDAYRHALVGLSRAGDVTQVMDVFDKLVADHGKPRSRKLLTPLLYVHARLGDVKETQRQFGRVSREFGLEQNTVCWNIVLTAVANANDLVGTFSTFAAMLKRGMRPNSHTFGTVMGLCANRGDVDSVRRLLKEAQNYEVPITMPMADTLVEAFVKNGRMDLAEAMAESLLARDIHGSHVRMWNTLLRGYALRVDFDSITRIRARMDEMGLSPDAMTYASLMLSLVLVGKVDMARRILRRLHRIKHLHATEYHYSLILYGYVRKRNRDMVQVVLREIQERFGRTTPTTSILNLRSQIQRDLQILQNGEGPTHSANLRLQNAEKFLEQTITDLDPLSLSTKLVAPGLGRSSRRRAFIAAHYETIIKAYGAKGAIERARELFDKCVKTAPAEDSSTDMDEAAPFRLVQALMVAHVRAGRYTEAEECWQTVFSSALKIARRVNVDLDELFLPESLESASHMAQESPVAESPVAEPPIAEPPRPSLPTSAQNDQEILINSSPPSPVPEQKPDILPSKRFLLSRSLTLYLQSLGYRDEPWRILDVVKEVEAVGFSLSTFNWSTVVQMLSISPRFTDQLEAFKVFEEKFVHNFQGWYRLHRGHALRPPEAPESVRRMERFRPRVEYLGKRSRRYWSQMQPDFMQPTYATVIHLNSALLRLREKSITEGAQELNTLYKVAPKTVQAIAKAPYLREQFQGVLLRQRSYQPNMNSLDKFILRQPYTWSGGVLGVGGTVRRKNTPYPRVRRQKKPHDPKPSKPAPDKPAAGAQDDLGDHSAVATPPENITAPEDEYDLAAEVALHHREAPIDDEPQDIPWRVKLWRRKISKRRALKLQKKEKERLENEQQSGDKATDTVDTDVINELVEEELAQAEQGEEETPEQKAS